MLVRSEARTLDPRPSTLASRTADWHSTNWANQAAAKGWEKAGIAQLLDESFSLFPEDPFEEIEGSIEIS